MLSQVVRDEAALGTKTRSGLAVAERCVRTSRADPPRCPPHRGQPEAPAAKHSRRACCCHDQIASEGDRACSRRAATGGVGETSLHGTRPRGLDGPRRRRRGAVPRIALPGHPDAAAVDPRYAPRIPARVVEDPLSAISIGPTTRRRGRRRFLPRCPADGQPSRATPPVAMLAKTPPDRTGGCDVVLDREGHRAPLVEVGVQPPSTTSRCSPRGVCERLERVRGDGIDAAQTDQVILAVRPAASRAAWNSAAVAAVRNLLCNRNESLVESLSPRESVAVRVTKYEPVEAVSCPGSPSGSVSARRRNSTCRRRSGWVDGAVRVKGNRERCRPGWMS